MLILPLFYHTYASKLLTNLWMCAKGAILGEKISIYMSSATSSRLFIIISPVGLEEDTRRKWVARGKGDFQTNSWPYGCWNSPPITDLNAWVVLIHVGKKVVTRGGGWARWPGC